MKQDSEEISENQWVVNCLPTVEIEKFCLDFINEALFLSFYLNNFREICSRIELIVQASSPILPEGENLIT